MDPSTDAISRGKKDRCWRCEGLNLEKTFEQRNMTVQISTIWTVARVHPDLESYACSFCRFLAETVKLMFGANHVIQASTFVLRAYPASVLRGIYFDFPIVDSGIIDRTSVLGMVKESWPDIRSPKDHLICATSSPASPSNPQPGIRGRRLHNTVDFDVLAGWIGTCRMQSRPGRSHLACQNIDPEFACFLRLIDCEARQIVEGASNCEYLALSYIWGSARNLPFNPPTTDACYPLPDNIPRTIEDAVIATRKLGYRFLWVDRYCIHQCDEDDMHNQLNSMDLIYTNATATLIAVAGTDPNSGLPGVSSTLRTRQAVVECGNTELVSTLRDPAKTIRASKWASRGWTYQEAVFSRRRLVFTEQQVYFGCKLQQHALL